MRLVKSDTDGYDVTLVPAVAKTWADSKPVLFFEYDHELTRLAGHDPVAVWDELADLGYQHARVWDNGGRPIGMYPIDDMAERATARSTSRSISATSTSGTLPVVHADDEAGLRALRDVLPADPA